MSDLPERIEAARPYPLGPGEMPIRGEYFERTGGGQLGYLSQDGHYTWFGRGIFARLKMYVHAALRAKEQPNEG